MILMTIFASLSLALQDTIPPERGVEDIAADTVLADTSQPQMVNIEQAESEEIIPVYVWEYDFRPDHIVSETDSTLRWVNILNLTDRFARRKGGMTYRTGTTGRLDGVDFHTYENRHFEAEMNGLILNDPLTGAINWNRVPIHKISSLSENSYGAVHRSEIRLRDHYLTQPRTYLNYDEGKFNYRSLEFSVTHNLNEKTNLDITFWDRRDGIGYENSIVEGNQIVIMGYHQLTDSWLLKAGFINNSMDQDQSFGYNFTDPQLFIFNRFDAQPNQFNARSDESSKDIYVQAHRRSSIDDNVQSEFGLHYQSDERRVFYSADSIATNFRNIELYANQRLEAGDFKTSVTARPFYLENREPDQLTRNEWAGVKGQVNAGYSLNGLQLYTTAGGMIRSDSQASTDLSARLILKPFNWFSVTAFGGYLNSAPDIQALYWQSEEFSGNEGLSNEQSVHAGVESELKLGSYISLGARSEIRNVENAVFVNPNGDFENIDPYSQLSGVGWLGLDSSLFEGELSATYKTFTSTQSNNPVNQNLANSGDRLWLTGSFYWKNYLFDRATFVKAGLIGTLSPNLYRTSDYITPLNRWQHGSSEFFNPSFTRLDLDVSARIRWFMVLLRWENLLDGVTQRGYFETVGYPMPERRFLLGLRILFTN